MKNTFKELLEASHNILITSHTSPDPDAVSSALLMGTTLRANFPDKRIKMVLEEEPSSDLSFLDGYDKLAFEDVVEAVKEFRPELFILVDSGNFYRCSRKRFAELPKLLQKNGTRTVIIDHHEEDGSDAVDVYINHHRPAAVQEVYELLFGQLKLNKPSGYAQTTLLGILTDTARHKFDNPYHRETYAIVSDLIDAGASIEKLEDKLERYDRDQLEVFAHLLSNIADSHKGYTISYITDGFTADWLKQRRSIDSFKRGCDIFTAQFLKNFETNLWGFIVHPELQEWPGCYGVSFRSSSGARDVSVMARALGGGGHKPAAGAKFTAKNVAEALAKVKSAIVE